MKLHHLKKKKEISFEPRNNFYGIFILFFKKKKRKEKETMTTFWNNVKLFEKVFYDPNKMFMEENQISF